MTRLPTRQMVFQPVSANIITTFAFTVFCSIPTFGQQSPITDVAFTPEGNSIACCSQNGLQVLTWPELDLIRKVDIAFENLHCIAFSPNREKLAIAGGNPAEEGIVQILTWPQCTLQTTLTGHLDSVASIAWDGNTHVISASLDRTLKRWDLASGKVMNTYRGHSRAVRSARSLTSDQLVTAGNDNSVRLWDAETATLKRTLNQHTKPINTIAVCPTSTGRPIIATAATDRTIRFWQPTIGRMMRYIRLDSTPLDICWLNQTLMAACCEDGQLRIVNAERVELVKTKPVIQGWAYAVAAHPTDGTVAVGGSNGQIRRVTVEQ